VAAGGLGLLSVWLESSTSQTGKSVWHRIVYVDGGILPAAHPFYQDLRGFLNIYHVPGSR
jgi:hypothetical protein